MPEIKFTILGNQENPKGNPIPYTRMTQGTKWTKRSKRYFDWKDYVKAQYIDAVRNRPDMSNSNLLYEKPIPATKEKISMSLKIYFKNDLHADCDNIFKGIADALFMNDKYLVTNGFDFEYAKEGKVEVTIKI